MGLPRTYQDTILVCRELGIDYIWIDSLCIVQDDVRDWREQASRMADVYELAYVTIAAVKAEDASQGLFSLDPDSRIGSQLPNYPWAHVRQQLDLPDPFTSELNWLKQENNGKALYKRGWTFQELSLSPRVLHFGAQEVMWFCREATVCEGDLGGNIHLSENVAVNMWSADYSLQQLWHLIVYGYSWRNLTFGKDKFPAIAAFASRIQAMSPEKTYVAGLWEDTLLLDLLWVCIDHCLHSEPPYPVEPGVIPSWSWASAKVPVYWQPPRFDSWQCLPCTEVIQITYNTRGSPILGDIIEASLVLQAPVIKLYKTYHVSFGNCWEREGTKQEPHLVLLYCSWDQLGSSYRRCDYNDMPLEALAIPLIASKSKNALLVKKDGPDIYGRVGVGILATSKDILEAKGRKGKPLPSSTMTNRESGESRSAADGPNRKWDEQEGQEKTWELEASDCRYIEVMGRLERQVVKLI